MEIKVHDFQDAIAEEKHSFRDSLMATFGKDVDMKPSVILPVSILSRCARHTSIWVALLGWVLTLHNVSRKYFEWPNTRKVVYMYKGG